MAQRTIGMTAVPNMQRIKAGVVNTTTLFSNPIRCAALVEEAKQKVTQNDKYSVFFDSIHIVEC